jgi:hypothetical protein
MSSFESESTLDNEHSIIYESLTSEIAKVLNKIINKNEEKDEYIKNVMDQSYIKFHSIYLPIISLEDYIIRIKKYIQIDDSILICSIIYIDRLILKGLFISQYNIYRLFLACIFDAYKLFEDKRYNINYFSQIGGVSSEELCYLEYEFVCLIDFNLFINESDYLKYFQFLNQKCQIQLNESND